MHKRRGTRFTDASGYPITNHQGTLDEPTAPAVEAAGPAITVRYTPQGLADERYLAGQAAGPTARARVEISTDAGADYDDAAAGVAVGATGVEETLLVRGVGLPFAGDDTEQSTFQLGVASSGEADWLG
jgi:hypothetical protein